jgi:hypothetical protein
MSDLFFVLAKGNNACRELGGLLVLTISGFFEAMRRVAVRCEDGDFVAEVLETDGGVDDEPFGTADA